MIIYLPDVSVVSKSNTRWKQKGNSKKLKAIKEFERAVAEAASPYQLDLESESGLPVAKRTQWQVSVGSHTTIDTDNVLKAVLDALEGVLYVNDSQVRYVQSYTVRKRTPGVLIVAEIHNPDFRHPFSLGASYDAVSEGYDKMYEHMALLNMKFLGEMRDSGLII